MLILLHREFTCVPDHKIKALNYIQGALQLQLKKNYNLNLDPPILISILCLAHWCFLCFLTQPIKTQSRRISVTSFKLSSYFIPLAVGLPKPDKNLILRLAPRFFLAAWFWFRDSLSLCLLTGIVIPDLIAGILRKPDRFPYRAPRGVHCFEFHY